MLVNGRGIIQVLRGLHGFYSQNILLGLQISEGLAQINPNFINTIHLENWNLRKIAAVVMGVAGWAALGRSHLTDVCQ